MSVHIAHQVFIHIQDGIFPLYTASKKGDDRIVDVLLKSGAKVNLQTKVKALWVLLLDLCVGGSECVFKHTSC